MNNIDFKVASLICEMNEAIAQEGNLPFGGGDEKPIFDQIKKQYPELLERHRDTFKEIDFIEERLANIEAVKAAQLNGGLK